VRSEYIVKKDLTGLQRIGTIAVSNMIITVIAPLDQPAHATRVIVFGHRYITSGKMGFDEHQRDYHKAEF